MYRSLLEHVRHGEGLSDVIGVSRHIGNLVDIVLHVRSADGSVGTGGEGQHGCENCSETHFEGREEGGE